tara:strand:+ start:243 stop:551 length:309 start_codon:yes stop_codon:yes gene_type:complete
VIRQKALLEIDQATSLMEAFSQNQLHDLLPFLRIDQKGAKKNYRLCIDCPTDSKVRIANKLEDSLGITFEWVEYDTSKPAPEATGMTPEFKDYVKKVAKARG